MSENIFASIKSEEIILPLTILNGYAESFNKTFADRLVFEVKKRMEDEFSAAPWVEMLTMAKKEQEEKILVSRAFIVAPGLNNYKLLVLKLQYKVSEVYPCHIESMLEDVKYDCNSAEDVQKALDAIFSADTFKRPVKMLLSQLMQ